MDKLKEDKVKCITKYNKILYHSQFQYHSFIYYIYHILSTKLHRFSSPITHFKSQLVWQEHLDSWYTLIPGIS